MRRSTVPAGVALGAVLLTALTLAGAVGIDPLPAFEPHRRDGTQRDPMTATQPELDRGLLDPEGALPGFVVDAGPHPAGTSRLAGPAGPLGTTHAVGATPPDAGHARSPRRSAPVGSRLLPDLVLGDRTVSVDPLGVLPLDNPLDDPLAGPLPDPLGDGLLPGRRLESGRPDIGQLGAGEVAGRRYARPWAGVRWMDHDGWRRGGRHRGGHHWGGQHWGGRHWGGQYWTTYRDPSRPMYHGGRWLRHDPCP